MDGTWVVLGTGIRMRGPRTAEAGVRRAAIAIGSGISTARAPTWHVRTVDDFLT